MALRERAVANLVGMLDSPEVHADELGGMLVWDGTYEASLLLVDPIRTQLAEHVRGELHACAPARDVMMFADADQPRGVARMRQIAAEVEQSQSYLISRTVLVHRGGWERWEAAG